MERERHSLPSEPPSYSGKALLTAIAYLFGWLIGFILNVVFYNDAKRDAVRYGRDPSGLGCLGAMLWFQLAFLVLIVVSVVFALVIVGTGNS
jgi:hypothetical protein